MKESRRFYEVSRFYLRILVALVERLRADGVEHVPVQGPVILASNHINSMDILSLTIPVPRVVHLMGKVELFRIPVLGWYIRTLGAFPVRRGEGDREALRQALEILAAGQVLGILPEGHRSGTGRLQAGKSGTALLALRSGAPVVPVAIWGTERTFKGFRFGPWRPTVHVVYGEPFRLEASGPRNRHEDVERGIDTIMRRIAAMLPPQYRGVYAEPAAVPVVAPPNAEALDVVGADPVAAERALEESPKTPGQSM
jgi:1-acyl-sn-glycerol-3-phosphate acyltransferase